MQRFRLNDKSKESISKKIGIPFEELILIDAETIHLIIEKKIKKKLKRKRWMVKWMRRRMKKAGFWI